MFKKYCWKKRPSLLSSLVAIFVFLQGALCYANDFTLAQLVTGVNLLREEIQSGELLLSITGYESPIMTLIEAQQWLAERKVEVRQEVSATGQGGSRL